MANYVGVEGEQILAARKISSKLNNLLMLNLVAGFVLQDSGRS